MAALGYAGGMTSRITVSELRASLSDVVRRVGTGARFVVIYRGRPAFRIVPLDDAERAMPPLAEDPLYQADALGSSSDRRTAAAHDEVIYQPHFRRSHPGPRNQTSEQ